MISLVQREPMIKAVRDTGQSGKFLLFMAEVYSVPLTKSSNYNFYSNYRDKESRHVI